MKFPIGIFGIIIALALAFAAFALASVTPVGRSAPPSFLTCECTESVRAMRDIERQGVRLEARINAIERLTDELVIRHAFPEGDDEDL